METEPKLIDQYVRTGKARLIYRHLLQLGSGSLALGEASECAGAQGQFWVARALIYREQNQLAPGDMKALQPLITELGLDSTKFQQCLEGHQFQKQVEDDYNASKREGITSRPVLTIGNRRFVGSLPLSTYQQALDAAGSS